MPTLDRKQRLADFVNQHSVRRGDFTLVSGQKSTYYIDGKLTCLSAEGAYLVAEAILDAVSDLDYDAIGGMDMGATPIVGSIAAVSHQQGRPTPTFVVRKTVKEHGTQKRIKGCLPETPSRVVIVDDVITSGGSILKAIEAVTELGHEVVCATCVVDRNAGGAELMAKHGIDYRPLLTLKDLGIES